MGSASVPPLDARHPEKIYRDVVRAGRGRLLRSVDMGSVVIGPPLTEDDLRGRAAWLAGKTIDEVAAAIGVGAPPVGARGKGKVGGLIEKVLGAESGSAAAPD